MQTGSPETLIGWKSGKTTFVPLWDRMEGAGKGGGGACINRVKQDTTQHSTLQ